MQIKYFALELLNGSAAIMKKQMHTEIEHYLLFRFSLQK